MIVTRKMLDAARCLMCGQENCADEVLFMHGRCHMHADAEVSYKKGTGLMLVTCSVCQKEIMTFPVADTAPQTHDC